MQYLWCFRFPSVYMWLCSFLSFCCLNLLKREHVSSPACPACSLWLGCMKPSVFSFLFLGMCTRKPTSYFTETDLLFEHDFSIKAAPAFSELGVRLSNTLVAGWINASEIRDAKCLIKAGVSSPFTYLSGERKCFSFIISNIAATLFLIPLLMRLSRSDKTCTTKWVFDTNFFSPSHIKIQSHPSYFLWSLALRVASSLFLLSLHVPWERE